MKNIEGFFPKNKYSNPGYEQVSDGVYFHDGKYLTALSFQQEPEFDEGTSASHISQYPLEDILDKYCVYISDYFETLNTASSQICYLEFTGSSEKDIMALRSIIGKHVYCREMREKNNAYVELVIE